MREKVTIAGAGIAGLTAAINLAKAGFNVVVIERRPEVGARFNGDFQFFENWTQEENVLKSLKNMNVRINFPIIPIQDGKAYDYKYREYKLHYEKPVIYMVKRGSSADCLDFRLKEQAAELGVRFKFGERADPDEVDIIATGPHSKQSLVYVKGVRFETDILNDIRVIFSPDIAPNGYAYMVVYEKTGIICTAYRRGSKLKKRASTYLEDAIEAFQNTGSFGMGEVAHFSNYAINPLVKSHSKIVIGEAGGFQDVTWGFGMRMAVTSGYLASISIIEGKDYWRLVNKHVLPYVVSTTFNLFLYEPLGKLSSFFFLKILTMTHNPMAILDRIYRPSMLKAAFFPLLNRCVTKRQKSKMRLQNPSERTISHRREVL